MSYSIAYDIDGNGTLLKTPFYIYIGRAGLKFNGGQEAESEHL